MRAIAAPASLKGVLSAVAAADALADGLRAGGAEAIAVPVADGGDGTLDVLERALGGEWREVDVSAPLGGTVRAPWLLLPARNDHGLAFAGGAALPRRSPAERRS
jgi:glycerate kinase